MANIKYNVNVFNSVVLPNIKEAKDSLEQARNQASNYQCPMDFSYYDLLCGIESRIQNIVDRLDKFNQWNVQLQNLYKEAVQTNQDDIKQIESVEIKRRIRPTIL